MPIARRPFHRVVDNSGDGCMATKRAVGSVVIVMVAEVGESLLSVLVLSVDSDEEGQSAAPGVRTPPVLGRIAKARTAWALVAALVAGCVTGPPSDHRVIVGLVTKTDTNPFFVTIREAALSRADELGVELTARAGRYDGDWETQAEAVESLVASGAAGILITPSDPAALADAVRKARDAGVLVIALDTPFDPLASVDGTFATDSFKAGELIGVWARARTDLSVPDVKIVTLDGSEAQITIDVSRNQGFLSGFGIDIRDPTVMYDEDDPRIVGRAFTMGTAAGGRSAMEDLIQQSPEVNVWCTRSTSPQPSVHSWR